LIGVIYFHTILISILFLKIQKSIHNAYLKLHSLNNALFISYTYILKYKNLKIINIIFYIKYYILRYIFNNTTARNFGYDKNFRFSCHKFSPYIRRAKIWQESCLFLIVYDKLFVIKFLYRPHFLYVFGILWQKCLSYGEFGGINISSRTPRSIKSEAKSLGI
jgi:hypothetical protein